MKAFSFEEVSFSYNGKKEALNDISLQVEEGSFTCILGGNGSGKSTLAKLINALLLPDKGLVKVFGRTTNDPQNLFFVRSNAGMIFQNPDDQIVASVVEDDVAFGPENMGVPTTEMQERVKSALEQVGLSTFAKSETYALSGGQKQRVAIAGILAMHPKILILDEAGAMLDPRGQKSLFRVCRELNDQGLTIVFITHSMDEAAQADRVIILDEGSIAQDDIPRIALSDVSSLQRLHLDVPFASKMSSLLQARGLNIPTCLTESELIESIRSLMPVADRLQDQKCAEPAETPNYRDSRNETVTPSPFTDSHSDKIQTSYASNHSGSHTGAKASSNSSSCTSSSTSSSSKPLLSFEDVWYSYASQQVLKKALKQSTAQQTDKTNSQDAWGNEADELWALRDINFTIYQKDFLGIAGHTGSGKSTLLQLANGLLQPTKGKVLMEGLDLANKKLAREAHGHIGLVFQYPERQLFAATVYDDVAFGPRNLGLSEDEVRQRVVGALELVHLNAQTLMSKSPFSLSGGQQRRVAIAGILAMDPAVLVLDEPVAGLDPQAHDDLLALISELHEFEEKTIVMVSHNMDDLAYHCNRLLILNQGKVFAQGSPHEIFVDNEALRRIGLALPRALKLKQDLGLCDSPRLSGSAVSSILTSDELADLILQHIDEGAGGALGAPGLDTGKRHE